MEGRDQVRDMLKARLPDVKPSSWKIADGEDATEANGVLESWIEFETDVARGNGHIRVKNGQIWTLLTTMSELKGHEEPLGFNRPKGVKHGAESKRRSWKENRDEEVAELGIRNSPIALSSEGVKEASRLGRACASLMYQPLSSNVTNGRAIAGANATNLSAFMIRYGMTTCLIYRFRRIGRCSRPKIRLAIG